MGMQFRALVTFGKDKAQMSNQAQIVLMPNDKVQKPNQKEG
jgi:hypothetical protein